MFRFLKRTTNLTASRAHFVKKDKITSKLIANPRTPLAGLTSVTSVFGFATGS